MSLQLSFSKPQVVCTVAPDSGTVFVGDYEISMQDFLHLAEYVLTNTDLTNNDPRLEFVKKVGVKLKIVPGYNPGKQRLEI